MKTVCLISGGLDSFVSAGIARKDGYELYGLTIDYSQKHKKEIEYAKKIAGFLNVDEHKIITIDLSFLSSALTSRNIKIPEKPVTGIPVTYVPARNTIFISLALAYAENINADAIYLGINHIDYSGYPDCRPEYIEAYQKLINIATQKTVKGGRILLKTPLVSLSKSEIILIGNSMHLDFSLSWSCYKGEEKACGKCPSCVIRLKGFEKAGLKDPLEYK
ncbi:MAG: 7-cyano-7-deazaguanine synthase QueC [Candidatus Omnitrophica bacterium]|nr:7-cyano-7-deazaguanine synthase QueC [Candidatus Omnitrophota bacterium]